MNGETSTRLGVIFVHPTKWYFVNSITTEHLQTDEVVSSARLRNLDIIYSIDRC
jgi:hypothetical protein